MSGDDGPSLGVIATVAVSLASLYCTGATATTLRSRPIWVLSWSTAVRRPPTGVSATAISDALAPAPKPWATMS